MHATVRRYEGVDKTRTAELTKKVDETLMPSLSKLPGFSGYFLIKGENDVITSIDLFNDSKQASDSTRIASEWVCTRSSRTCFRTRRRSPTARLSRTRRAPVSARSVHHAFDSREARDAGPLVFRHQRRSRLL
jgi:hypothetical protein